jgi:predicted amidohydrolase YtcJ
MMNLGARRTLLNAQRIVAAALVLFVCGITGAASAEDADVIVIGGTIRTLDPDQPFVEAVAVKGQYIVYAGGKAEVEGMRGEKTRVIDAAGLAVLPGLVDAHAHLAGLGKALRQVDLVGSESVSEARERVRARQARTRPGAWIEGRGWDQNDWPVKEFPTHEDLAGTEANPVYLRRVDGHAAWLNRRALDACGITAETEAPDGGRIIRDEAGNPTGVLIDNAMNLVEDVKPEPSFEERLDRYRTAIAECHRYGLTGIHDAGVGKENLEALRHLREKGELRFRVYVMLDSDEADFAEGFMRGGPEIDPEHYLTVRSVKVYADGALGSRGAALLAPYADEPGNNGLMMHPREELLRRTMVGISNGFQVCTHAIGDAANRLMLDVYEEAMDAVGPGDYRLRIEHAQVLSPEDIPRFSERGIIASMQPTHATSDMYWAGERVGTERLAGAYAWRTLLESGAVICCGSDFPVEGVNPLWGVHAAVTRQDQDGWPSGGWYPDERMSVDEAVRGFTENAAFAGFEESFKGRLQVGMCADITIVNADPYKVSLRKLRNLKVTHTIVGGKVVFENPHAETEAE